MRAMNKFQIVIKDHSVTCESCQSKLPKSRLLFTASDVEFWAIGKIGNGFDKVANVAMNKMIEIGRRASELRTVK